MATRIGWYTGRVYKNIPTSNIKECCSMIKLTMPEGAEGYLNATRLELRQRCLGCYDCEEARKDRALPYERSVI